MMKFPAITAGSTPHLAFALSFPRLKFKRYQTCTYHRKFKQNINFSQLSSHTCTVKYGARELNMQAKCSQDLGATIKKRTAEIFLYCPYFSKMI